MSAMARHSENQGDKGHSISGATDCVAIRTVGFLAVPDTSFSQPMLLNSSLLVFQSCLGRVVVGIIFLFWLHGASYWIEHTLGWANASEWVVRQLSPLWCSYRTILAFISVRISRAVPACFHAGRFRPIRTHESDLQVLERLFEHCDTAVFAWAYTLKSLGLLWCSYLLWHWQGDGFAIRKLSRRSEFWARTGREACMNAR